MSWVALLDKKRADFNPDGLAQMGPNVTHALPMDLPPLTKGSLVVETRVSPYDRPQTLLGFVSGAVGGMRLSLQAVPGGGVVLILNRGATACHVAVNLDTGGRADMLRITYSWDCHVGLGRLAVECPGTFRVAQKEVAGPIGLSMRDIQECILEPEARVFASDLSYVAMSNCIEPIGPMPSLTAQTPVMTDDGYVPVGHLQRGDVVQTPNGDLVPVLHNIQRTVPAAGLFAPIRLRAPFFGLTQEIVTSPTQRLVIGGSRVEYTFGSEFVLVPAGHLLHGNAAVALKGPPLVTYCQLLLPNHEAVLAAGTYLESLDLGRLRRRRDILRATLMARYNRAKLPEHARTIFPVLREFDALTLAAQRAA